MFLDEDQIRRLTKCKRHDAQARELQHLGIKFEVRRDGSLAVLEMHVNKIFGGIVEKQVKVKTASPNWDGLNA